MPTAETIERFIARVEQMLPLDKRPAGKQGSHGNRDPLLSCVPRLEKIKSDVGGD